MTHCRVRVPLIAALLLGAGAFAAEPPSPFTCQEEFCAFLQGYYKNPQPGRIEAATIEVVKAQRAAGVWK